MGLMKKEIVEFRNRQEKLEKTIYVCKNEHRELLERCKQVRTHTWIADTYIDTLFETENALEILIELKNQGFINFELKDRDMINYVAYKSKIAKALNNL